jgi:hypothetical protein
VQLNVPDRPLNNLAAENHKQQQCQRDNKYSVMNKELFRSHEDYWQVADNIKRIYMSDGSLATLLDFERVLDEMDLYAFRNWDRGELVAGPTVGRYRVSATFMWPEDLMPDPRGGRRLLPFDCQIEYRRIMMKIPVRINDPSDYRPGTKKARIIERPVWLVEITMPKSLISDIRTGSVELEGEDIDLQDLDDAYEKDLDQEGMQNDQIEQNAERQLQPITPPAV